MKSLLSLVFILQLISRILNTPDIDLPECKKLPKGCKLKQYFIGKTKTIGHFLVCHKLSQSSEFNEKMINDSRVCQFENTRFLFQLSKSEILDTQFDFEKVIEFSLNFLGNTYVLFTNLKGISLSYFQKNSKKFYDLIVLLVFYHSDIQFFIHGSKVNSCNGLALNNSISIFQYISPGKIRFIMENVKFKQPICPLVFKNTSFVYFIVTYQINTFYRTNKLSFAEHKSIDDIDLGIDVQKVYLDRSFNLDLDKTILNEEVFKSINSLYINGQLNSIQRGLLKSFKKLNFIELDALHWRRLVHKEGISWIQELNSDVRISYKSNYQVEGNQIGMHFIIILNNQPQNRIFYYYFHFDRFFPDEDFCIYKSFPFEQYILLKLSKARKQGNLTCTSFWLIQYLNWFPTEDEYENSIYKRLGKIIESNLIRLT